MTTGDIFSTGILLSAGAGVLYYLRGIPQIIYRKLRQQFIHSVRVYQYDELFQILERYMAKHYRAQYRDVEGCLVQETETLRHIMHAGGGISYSSNKKVPLRQSVQFKQETNTFIIKYKGKRLFISKAKEKLDHVQNTRDLYFAKFHIWGWRAKDAIEDFLSSAIAFSEVNPENNVVKVHSCDSWGEWEVAESTKIKPLEKVILPKGVKQMLIGDIEHFLESEDWYEGRGIPYKRGYCLYGPPGTGKTTLALAIAHKLGRSIRCLNLNAVDNDVRLISAMRKVPDNSVLLIEDIDKIFSGRENVRADSKISFSSFINCLDGAFYRPGLITIITTNHIEKLDEALLRTGRMDRKIEVPKPTAREITEYLSVFYADCVPLTGRFDITMSDVQEICIRNKEDMIVARQEIISKGGIKNVSERIDN